MNKSYIRNEAFLSEDLGDGVLLLSTTDNQVIELNRTGAQLWRRLEQPAIRSELVEELKRFYPDVNASILEADTDAFLVQATVCKAIEEV